MKPTRRKKGLVVHELPNETLVYDLQADRALALNPTAALVFKLCDGETTPAQMAQAVRARLEVKSGEPLVALALEQLAKAKLLEGGTARRVGAIPRREALRKLGVASALLPAVFALLAPTAASAGSTVADAICNATRSTAGCNAIFGNMKCATQVPQKYCRSRGTGKASRSCTCR